MAAVRKFLSNMFLFFANLFSERPDPNFEQQRLLMESITSSALSEYELGDECFEQKYRRILLHYFTVAIHRNVDAHYKTAEKILRQVGRWRTVNSISAVVLFVATTSETLRTNIAKIDLTSVLPPALNPYLAWMFPLEPNLIFLFVGLIFLSTSLFQSLGRFEDGYFAHKTASASFSELRRDMLDALGAKKLTADRMRRFREQYQVIVDNSPMTDRRSWNEVSKRAEHDLSPILRLIYDFGHRADNKQPNSRSYQDAGNASDVSPDPNANAASNGADAEI
jgi:hypothetical protein